MTGDVAAAVPLLDEALALLRRVENPFGIALTLGERAHAARLQGDQILAARLFAESIAAAAEIGVVGSFWVRSRDWPALPWRSGSRSARHDCWARSRPRGDAAASAGLPCGPHRAHPAPRCGPASRSWRSPPPGTRVGTPIRRRARRRPRDRRIRRAGTTTRSRRRQRLRPDTARTRCAAPASRGRSDREIGEALFIGTRTVQTHVGNLFVKLGVNARAEAAAVAVRRGLV